MKEQMVADSARNDKGEYNSKVGLALLFELSGGTLTPHMAELVSSDKMTHSRRIQSLIKDIKHEWDSWDSHEGGNPHLLLFDNFYIGFMAPYFSCYQGEDIKRGLEALDIEKEGFVDWHEFKQYLVWAGREYPDVESVNELKDIAFRRGLIPAMWSHIDTIKNSDDPAIVIKRHISSQIKDIQAKSAEDSEVAAGGGDTTSRSITSQNGGLDSRRESLTSDIFKLTQSTTGVNTSDEADPIQSPEDNSQSNTSDGEISSQRPPTRRIPP